MRIVHAADVHLDRAFTESSVRLNARERRLALRDALLRIVDCARQADALCISGDLYEHEHVTGDTANMLASRFEELDKPVLLLPGNHDPYLPGSVYERVEWPRNVHVFSSSRPESFELSSEVVVWGVAYTQRELRPDVVRDLRLPDDGRTHLLMLHGSLVGGFAGAEGDHCPVTHAELQATGASFVLLGHHHAGLVVDGAAYPGSPEPLTWGELGTHSVNLLQVEAGRVTPDLQEINRLSFEELELDVTGAASSVELEEKLTYALEALTDEGLGIRARLQGQVAPECEVKPFELAARCGQDLLALVVEDGTWPAFDLEKIAVEPTVRGRFVHDLLERARAAPEEADRMVTVAQLGLRALAGREDLVSVD